MPTEFRGPPLWCSLRPVQELPRVANGGAVPAGPRCNLRSKWSFHHKSATTGTSILEVVVLLGLGATHEERVQISLSLLRLQVDTPFDHLDLLGLGNTLEDVNENITIQKKTQHDKKGYYW